MIKRNCTVKRLAIGEILLYDLGPIKLHVYMTNDPLQSVVPVIVKGSSGIVLESPAFANNILELESYLKSAGIKIAGHILSYHMAGADEFLHGVPRYSTKNAEFNGRRGGALLKSFAKMFSKSCSASPHKIDVYMKYGCVAIAGIKMNIRKDRTAFDIEFPEVNARYIHILGHDVHPVMRSTAILNAEIKKLRNLIARNYRLILSSHHAPEDMGDAAKKLEYLEAVLAAAKKSRSRFEFKRRIISMFPRHLGRCSLDLTAKYLFQH
ncbi:MAG: hypothetical protein FWC61_00135 [Proteobacteria bacterium]|nr:hypothetical protein [Pseudomonadota bacterium]